MKMYKINEEVYEKMLKTEEKLTKIFQDIDKQEFKNSLKVLEAFNEFNINESDFASTTGYGYNDIGRDKIEQVFARVLGAEKALVRNQFISGSHALTVTLFGLLRPGDTLLSITGLPYDTLHEVIGINDNPSSLKSFNINYEQIDLTNDDFDYESIRKALNSKKIKVIRIGLQTTETIEAGCDIMVGSLIKNLGGGIAPNGAYIAGREDLVNLCAERLTLPGEGMEVGPSLGVNREFLMGLYHAPSVVASSLKTAILTSAMLEDLGYKVSPSYNEPRADIVETIIFGNSEDLIKYCEGIQSGSAIDSNSVPEPVTTPGYEDKIIMASGSFTQGSSIEISCDGPLREPYILYQQGGLTYEYGKIAVMIAISKLLNLKN